MIESSWAFTQGMFAVHYAPNYWITDARGGHGRFEFPSGHLSDDVDFLCFACVIGPQVKGAMSALSSDNAQDFSEVLVAALIRLAH
jgi:uncharacterized membrane protein